MADEGGGDGEEDVGHVAARLVDQEAQQGGGEGGDQVDQAWKEGRRVLLSIAFIFNLII